MTTKFKAGDKVRCIKGSSYGGHPKLGELYTIEATYSMCGQPSVDIMTANEGIRRGWYASRFEPVVEEATPTTLRYADLQPGDVIKVTWELTVVTHSPHGALRCTRADGNSVMVFQDAEPFLTIELVSRKPTPLTVGDTVRCTLTDKIGTLTGTSEGKYAWVVFGNSTRPKTRMLTELVRHTAA